VSRMRVYVAGPMTGIAQFNFPAFDHAAKVLRALDYDVVSPAELDSPETRALAIASPDGDPSHYAQGDSWGDFLARDVKLIADEGIEAIVTLPGWQKSRGARLETFVGRLCGLTIYEYASLGALNPGVTDPKKQAEMKKVSPEDIDRAHAFAGGAPLGVRHATTVEATPTTITGEVRVVNGSTGGEKGKKPESYSLIPWSQLDEVARLYNAGAQKYSRDNWRKGYDWSLSFDSLIRHARSWWEGEETDPETGCSHLASVVFHAFGLMYFKEHHPQLDDRPGA